MAVMFKLIKEILQLFLNSNIPSCTKTAFSALVDSIILQREKSAGHQGFLQPDAVDMHIDEYLLYTLNHYAALRIMLTNFNIYLVNATAEMLNTAARQLIAPKKNTAVKIFAALDPVDRCRALALLEQRQIDPAKLPLPFRNNPGMAANMASMLIMLTASGYYSEWSGYGSTRLEPPEQRIIEHFPPGWQQVGYPGPSRGYRALRGYLIDKFTEWEA